ncbi:MAG: hypothetical protein UY40_C0003G0021 [candidate division CPR1 bacterium GW2011_GWC1_49_13]|uniref:Uncharacterized protein n=1 Tax=candidate division CPR1 bacterium GW2011_GWC1_49_13 TaxID=1618342 RepID=A0A0G1XU86_9BACT|nr:MAG: hypothetical protein UY40_C0003G0021 [candidate division CPR1 bacterium GW2011_GWC1_49_13]
MLKDIVSAFFVWFQQNAEVIFLVSSALILLAGLVLVFADPIRRKLFQAWVARNTFAWWANFVRFVGQIRGRILGAFKSRPDPQPEWSPLARSIAEEIRQGKFSKKQAKKLSCLVSECVHCEGKGRSARWSASYAHTLMGDIEKELDAKTICMGCLYSLAELAVMLLPEEEEEPEVFFPFGFTPDPPIPAANTTMPAATPETAPTAPAATGQQRGSPEKMGMFTRTVFLMGAFGLIGSGIREVLSSITSGISALVWGVILLSAGVLILRNVLKN